MGAKKKIGLIYFFSLILCLLLSEALYAAERKVPAASILAAARTIIPQAETQSEYHVSGHLECYLKRMGDEPPFWVDSACFVHIGTQIAKVQNHEILIPYLISSLIFKEWSIYVPFHATSIKDTSTPSLYEEEAFVDIDFDFPGFCWCPFHFGRHC